MIPSTPRHTGSRAERRVFDRLREAFTDDPECSPVAFHSLNLTRHAYKRFGEIDFLLCGPAGIFVLEVKGGGIACCAGEWQTTDRSSTDTMLNESPFKQAETALHALERRLESEFPTLARRFIVGYGVLFPDCKFDVRGSEWEPAMVGDERALRDIQGWLASLFRFWKGKSTSRIHPDAAELKKLRQFFRPDFEVAVPLHVEIAEIEERVVSLTADQMLALDIIEANPRVLCEGGAGTGKTFLAMELARRWAGAGKQVALVCRSPWLRHYLDARFQIPGVSTALPEGLATAARRGGVRKFDALIADEGQDLFEMPILDLLDGSIVGGWTAGHWCIFHDVNNQSGIFGAVDPDAIGYLDSLSATHIPLKTNCRNTRVILEMVKSRLGADMGVRGSGEGPIVRELHASSQEDAAQILREELRQLIDIGGLGAGNVTILSPRPFAESAASLLPSGLRESVCVLDEFSIRSFPPRSVSFAEIRAFKGLENEAVILIDLSRSETSPDYVGLCYVGMSRPRASLSIVWLP
ncbi:MAG: NERD domain-containing protein/DEAD/DEAH box helicase [Verrucomicrobia bacterium]|nr:NERD domain-containing protein/DEAD/DEAH box helicase [Verrucomicrobiota bacterium]